MPRPDRWGAFAAHAFALSGVSKLARLWRPSHVCVLTFHGLRESCRDPRLLDAELHGPVGIFEKLCSHLLLHYEVVSVAELVRARQEGIELPANAVAITFDDGFASNYHLGFPVLKRLGIPATIFLATGFVDGTELPWFVRLETALWETRKTQWEDLPLTGSADRLEAYHQLCHQFKSLPEAQAMTLLRRVEDQLEVQAVPGGPLPELLRPMTWDMVREMKASGLVDFGGHTHTHPILARCSEARQAEEISTCMARLNAELEPGRYTFAYPNGGYHDFNDASMRLLTKSGFEAGFHMEPGFVLPDDDIMALPRYGNPDDWRYLEAVVSGSMERFRQLRVGLGLKAEPND